MPDLHRHDATRAIHGGPGPDPTTGAITTPICQSTTFVQDAVGEDRGFTYTRSGNPTVAALEQALGSFEGAPPAVSFSTGMAAISALCIGTLRAGDRVIVSDVVYGGTVRLLRQVLAKFGVVADFVDTSDVDAVAAALRAPSGPAKFVFVETPANPTLKLTDLAAVAEIAHAHGAWLAVDNTFLTAALQPCFELGADIVLYSTTKYVEGHNSTVGGAVLARDAAILDQLRFVQNAVGFAQTPFESWLTIRGLKTLPFRMKAHSENALAVARWLEAHPQVRAVHYPGLESFAQFTLAQRQQRAGGGMVAFDLAGGADAGVTLLNNVELCALAENLGAVETLITHPATMTHAPVPPAERERLGITDGLVRLSVGLEHPEDIIADLERALGIVKREVL